jgi:hypothetical protein
MSKVTVISDSAGNILAMSLGHSSGQTAPGTGSRGPKGGLRARAGQKLHELNVPEDLESIKSWSELHSKVAPHIR